MALRVAVLGLAVIALGVPTAAQAAPPEHITIELADTSVDPDLSEACGTEVVFTISGTLKVTLWRNAEGLIVRELDRAQGGNVTFSAPETGNSFSFPLSQTSTYDYGDGAEVGSEVTLTSRGLLGHVTGFIPSDAGLLTLVGVVEGFDEFGIPEVDFPDDPIRETGNREAGEDIEAAFCEALTGA